MKRSETYLSQPGAVEEGPVHTADISHHELVGLLVILDLRVDLSNNNKKGKGSLISFLWL